MRKRNRGKKNKNKKSSLISKNEGDDDRLSESKNEREDDRLSESEIEGEDDRLSDLVAAVKKFQIQTKNKNSRSSYHEQRKEKEKYVIDDIVLEIISRLPVKSLLRFRSVCRKWKTLIANTDKYKEFRFPTIESDLLKCENLIRFIRGVLEGSIIVCDRSRTDLIIELRKKRFTYDLMLAHMSMGDLTYKKLQELHEERDKLLGKAEALRDESILLSNCYFRKYSKLLQTRADDLTYEKLHELHEERDKLLRQAEALKDESY